MGENIEKIKKESNIAADHSDYAPIKAVYDIWSSMCNLNERRFKLLPQHIRDYSKPAPTYHPPPIAQSAYNHSYGQSSYQTASPYANRQRQQQQQAVVDRSGTPPLY